MVDLPAEGHVRYLRDGDDNRQNSSEDIDRNVRYTVRL